MKRITLALGVALAALVVSGPVAARQAVPAPTLVNVTMKEFKFILSRTSVPKGTVTFRLYNKGKLPHDFAIAGKTSALIAKGKQGTLTVKLKSGKYLYTCPVAGHAKLGMKGTLTVK